MKFLIILFILGSSKIMPSLKEILKNSEPNEKIAVLVHLKEKPDHERIKNLSAKEYIEFLKNFCENSQREILNYLKENFSQKIEEIKPYWIFNGFYLKATKDVILKIAQREEIDYIIEDFEIKIEKPEISYESRTPEPNLIMIGVPDCWEMGYTGEGIIIGQMDTGVDTSHPALQGKWYPGGWYDAVNDSLHPYDDHGHGTYLMGIVLGGDGPGPFQDDIGVAPGARFVSCKVFDQNGSAPFSRLHAGFQKIAEWKSSEIDIKVVNNGWGYYTQPSLEFWEDCLNWRNLGIIPVFPIGNMGPNYETTAVPGNFPLVFGVGSVDLNGNITTYSSRGPAPNQPPWNDTTYWPRTDWCLTKPDICAPGVNIRSAWPGGGYQTISCTPTSASHLTGSIAILYQKNSSLDFYEIYDLILNSADQPPQGAPYPNNEYGWGILNVYNALMMIEIKEPYELNFPKEIFKINYTKSNPILKIYLKDKRNIKFNLFDICGRKILQMDRNFKQGEI